MKDNKDHTGLDSLIFAGITSAVKIILTPIVFLLNIVYIPCQLLVLPLMLILMVFSVLWMPCCFVIVGCGYVARSCWILRPIMFIVALPFVVLGAVLVTLAPHPSPMSIIDQMNKMHIMLSYPNDPMRNGLMD